MQAFKRMYTLFSTKTFDGSYKKIIKNNEENLKRTQKALKLLQQDPFYPSLKSHKVSTLNFGTKWSSWVTSNLRIIWDFDAEQKFVVLLLALAKHSGTHKEYK